MATDQLTRTRRGGAATGALAAPRRWRLDDRYLPVLGTLVVLVAMLAIGGSRYENFLTGRVLANLLINNSFLVVLAVGMTFVILTGGIDLSVGAVVALSSIVAAWMLTNGWDAVVAIPAAILTGTLIGLAVGLMVHVFEIQPFIATLAAMFLARGLCYLVAPESIPITDPTIVALARTRWGSDDGLVLTPSGLIALAVVAVAFVLLHYTRFGRTVYAIGGGEQSARLMGLPVARTKVLVYVISGTCAGLGGLLFAIFSRSGYALTGVGMELDAIAAVVIGGTLLTGGSGFVLGSVLGVLVLGLIQTAITFEGTLSSWWTKIVIGGLLLVFVVLQRLLALRRT
ncbi:galactofuranose ABC transporter, permease protein YjfF [Cellulomonas fimi]|uniref:Inner-membrane translocator n=1 Tax=Cellulomonas fimi (strain ATCC 484 / DSM 20113 / JCM 1341 / CCUG 24087 / LMG 16345 / NBRC 15513 / NCIMB 8980 / NCTC 7547 / NRS-133) TaxID=590998 RepID=F4H0Q5_CELFA|nr:galactofuranose ABC transporter, permease protein YjfF [Cellulomonas fimi]AEE45028.1 inner-membrane translocator [Cellulomonas fimi ATCC 484]NNH07997.1 sugar ABC transporter permease YjfF [Cellulomonas fimi]VEH28017.1 Inner membrane ABC transporter permease protein yjfF [Cellulomonas fimi]